MYTYYGGLAILVPLVAGLYIARRKEVNMMSVNTVI